MIEQANDRNRNNRGRTGAITEDQITHRMITSPDIQKIEKQLKDKDAAKRPAEKKGKKDGELRNAK